MRSFWRLKGVFATRNLALMAMFVAMSVALRPVELFTAPDFKLVSINFIPVAVGSSLFGPMPALLMGAASDLLGYFLFPQFGFFPGYTLSAMLTCLIYALWLYLRPVSVWRVAAAQFCNVVFVWFGVNFLWRVMMNGTGAAVFFSFARLMKNALFFPVYVGGIYGLCRISRYLNKGKRAPE